MANLPTPAQGALFIWTIPMDPSGNSTPYENTDNITLIAPASYGVGTTVSTTQVNTNARGVVVYLNITAIGTGTVLLHIQASDPVTGLTNDLFFDAAAIAANGFYIFVLYPGVSGGAPHASASMPLPRQWRVTAVVATAAVTFGVSASLIL